MPCARRIVGGLLAAALVTSGASAAAALVAAPPSPLEGTAWVLAELPHHTLLEGRAATLRFAAGRVLGFDGCNSFRGSYQALGASLQIDAPVSTLMACPAERLQQVEGFRAALARAAGYRSDGAGLLLLDSDGNLLARLSAQPEALAGSSWQATAINNGRQAVASVVAGSSVTLEFADDGKASGSAGCNRYTAAYRHEGAALRFETPAATQKACKRPDLMAQEESFLKALQTVAAARFDDDRLELRTADGALAVQLRRAGKR
jgi:heat shock protein HslJ